MNADALALALAWLCHLAEPPPPLVETARLVALEARRSPEHARSALLVAAVCFAESRAGLDGRAASRCGVRLHGHYVRDARIAVRVAAMSLLRWRRRCGNVRGAVLVYRHGRGCGAPDSTGYASAVLAVERRLHRLVVAAQRAIRESRAVPESRRDRRPRGRFRRARSASTAASSAAT